MKLKQRRSECDVLGPLQTGEQDCWVHAKSHAPLSVTTATILNIAKLAKIPVFRG